MYLGTGTCKHSWGALTAHFFHLLLCMERALAKQPGDISFVPGPGFRGENLPGSNSKGDEGRKKEEKDDIHL